MLALHGSFLPGFIKNRHKSPLLFIQKKTCHLSAREDTESSLTWTNSQRLDLSDCRVTADVIEVPAEKHLLRDGSASVEGDDVSVLQVHIPHMQIGHVPRERLREVPAERILVLSQNENSVPEDLPRSASAGARVPPLAVHVDIPVAVAAIPRDANVMPSAIVWEGGLVWEVLPVDDERQQDSSLDVQLAPQLELIGENRCGVGEDGGHLAPLRVPLDTDAHAEERQVREGHVDASKGLMGFPWEVQSGKFQIYKWKKKSFKELVSMALWTLFFNLLALF